MFGDNFSSGCRICIQRARGAEWTFDLREVQVKGHVQSLSDKLSDFLVTSFLHACCFLLHVQRIILKLEFFKFESLKRKHFSNYLSRFGWRLFRFRRKFSSTVVKTALVSMFFNRVYAIFTDSTQISINWSVGTALHVSTELFSGEANFLIKYLFQLVFHNLGGNFSGFWRTIFTFLANFSQHGGQNYISF